jgi:hypothetical protein
MNIVFRQKKREKKRKKQRQLMEKQVEVALVSFGHKFGAPRGTLKTFNIWFALFSFSFLFLKEIFLLK